ncbi:MAG: hypothetical protein H6Q74_227 [Firmicutes bacterium]|nr:hypothetical protein [Bacillota bacterium]
MAQEACMEHAGCKAQISQLEKNDVDIFKRLGEVEMVVWKAAGTSGIVTAIIVVLLEKMIK